MQEEGKANKTRLLLSSFIYMPFFHPVFKPQGGLQHNTMLLLRYTETPSHLACI